MLQNKKVLVIEKFSPLENTSIQESANKPTPTNKPTPAPEPVAAPLGACPATAISYVAGSSVACNCGSNAIQMQAFGNGSFANTVCADGSSANPINLSCATGIPKIHTSDNKRWWCNSINNN